MAISKASSVRWTREHRLIALNLYGKLLFGRLHKGNPLIVDVAERMGRTASSLAMKLSNFASLDPVLQARGIKGLPGAADADKRLWSDFQEHTAVLAPESEELLAHLLSADDSESLDFTDGDGTFVRRVVASPRRGRPALLDYRVVLSTQLKHHLSQSAIADNFGRYEGAQIHLPEQLMVPDPLSLAYHRGHLFQG